MIRSTDRVRVGAIDYCMSVTETDTEAVVCKTVSLFIAHMRMRVRAYARTHTHTLWLPTSKEKADDKANA